MRTRQLVVAITLSAAACGPGCTKNATTGRGQYLMYTRDQEIALGTQAQPQMVQEFGGKTADPALQGYIVEVGTKLSKVTEADNPTLPWEFTLLNSTVINAFALPGGKVFVTRGLADKMTNEAQLAGVLGHEIGHVCAKHSSERASDAMMAQIGVAVAGAAVGAATKNPYITQAAPVAFNAGGQMVVLKFSRDQESEADALGMRYMSRLKYNPAAQMQVMQILQAATAGGREPELFATHPYPETRIERIKKALATTYKGADTDKSYTFKETEYRERYLKRITLLPRPAEASGESSLASLGDPTTWCAHCAQLTANHRAQ